MVLCVGPPCLPPPPVIHTPLRHIGLDFSIRPFLHVTDHHSTCVPHRHAQRNVWKTIRITRAAPTTDPVEVQDAPQLPIEPDGRRCFRDLTCIVSVRDMPEWNAYPAELDELPNTLSRLCACTPYRVWLAGAIFNTASCKQSSSYVQTARPT